MRRLIQMGPDGLMTLYVYESPPCNNLNSIRMRNLIKINLFRQKVSATLATALCGLVLMVLCVSGTVEAGPAFTDAGWVTPGGGMGGGGAPYVLAMVCDDFGDVFAGGSFNAAGGVTASAFAGWDGTNWYALTQTVDGVVQSLAFDNSGHLFVGGSFTTIGGIEATNVAVFDGASWSALGPGLSGGVVNG
jgi:hypothetical protein